MQFHVTTANSPGPERPRPARPEPRLEGQLRTEPGGWTSRLDSCPGSREHVPLGETLRAVFPEDESAEMTVEADARARPKHIR